MNKKWKAYVLSNIEWKSVWALCSRALNVTSNLVFWTLKTSPAVLSLVPNQFWLNAELISLLWLAVSKFCWQHFPLFPTRLHPLGVRDCVLLCTSHQGYVNPFPLRIFSIDLHSRSVGFRALSVLRILALHIRRRRVAGIRRQGNTLPWKKLEIIFDLFYFGWTASWNWTSSNFEFSAPLNLTMPNFSFFRPRS
jgi:hypothetical protein